MFKSLRGVILQYVGLDQIIENVLDKLGNLDEVYLTGDLALGKNSPFIDLVLVGDIDKTYLYNLIEKAETLIDKKLRVGLYLPQEFTEDKLKDVGGFYEIDVDGFDYFSPHQFGVLADIHKSLTS